MEIRVMDRVLAANDAWASENRKLLSDRGCTMLNVIGSPGAGKTTLIESTIEALCSRMRIGVIEGDIATTKDAERIQKKGVPVYQINTGTACHLDANLVNAALREITADAALNLVIVENIGNLVCPAEFDIGEQAKIAVLSVTEGDDKIEKYPLLFSEAAALLITKTDLLPHTNFGLDYARETYQKFRPDPALFPLDSLSRQGFDDWITFLTGMVRP